MERPNIVLIVMDTVRADHLSCYGYHRKTTPNIDKIAKEGILFENAFSAAPWTPPAHASIFTGKYPSFHKTMGKDIRFKPANDSLVQVLSEKGYQTIGITCCRLLGAGTGFENGFQEFFEPEIPSLSYFKRGISINGLLLKDYIRTMIYGPDKGTHQATEAIRKLIKRKKIRKPFFMFINYFNCHTPYEPPRPFKKRFCPNIHRSRFCISELLLNATINRTTEGISNSGLNLEKLKWIATGQGGFLFAMKKMLVSREEWEVVKSWYDGEIAYLDHHIGVLVEFLREENLLDDTFLIITSDHGENFGEHHLAVHPFCLYDTVLHIPLIVSFPNVIPQGQRISSIASTIDIFPTVMDVSKIKFEKSFQGKSLYPFGNRKIHDFVCAEYGGLHVRGLGGHAPSKLEKIDKRCKCIRTTEFKYILTNGSEELYNIREDPSEEMNIISAHPKKARSLRLRLEKAVDTSYFGPVDFHQANKEDAEMLRRLKALGYV